MDRFGVGSINCTTHVVLGLTGVEVSKAETYTATASSERHAESTARVHGGRPRSEARPRELLGHGGDMYCRIGTRYLA